MHIFYMWSLHDIKILKFISFFLTLITFQHKWQYFQIFIENEKFSNLISEFNENYKVKDLRIRDLKA